MSMVKEAGNIETIEFVGASRKGDDLILELRSGEFEVVEGYYAPDFAEKTVQVGDVTIDVFALRVLLADSLAGGDVRVVGEVSSLEGEAYAVNVFGERRELKEGDDVFFGEELLLGETSALSLRMNDESTLTLGKGARMVIDSHVFDEGEKRGNESLLTLLKGTFLYLSGQIARQDYEDVGLLTPIGTIGIRGTSLVVEVRESMSVVLLSGAIEVKDDEGESRVLDEALSSVSLSKEEGVQDMGEKQNPVRLAKDYGLLFYMAGDEGVQRVVEDLEKQGEDPSYVNVFVEEMNRIGDALEGSAGSSFRLERSISDLFDALRGDNGAEVSSLEGGDVYSPEGEDEAGKREDLSILSILYGDEGDGENGEGSLSLLGVTIKEGRGQDKMTYEGKDYYSYYDEGSQSLYPHTIVVGKGDKALLSFRFEDTSSFFDSEDKEGTVGNVELGLFKEGKQVLGTNIRSDEVTSSSLVNFYEDFSDISAGTYDVRMKLTGKDNKTSDWLTPEGGVKVEVVDTASFDEDKFYLTYKEQEDGRDIVMTWHWTGTSSELKYVSSVMILQDGKSFSAEKAVEGVSEIELAKNLQSYTEEGKEVAYFIRITDVFGGWFESEGATLREISRKGKPSSLDEEDVFVYAQEEDEGDMEIVGKEVPLHPLEMSPLMEEIVPPFVEGGIFGDEGG